ncbi:MULTISPECIES: class I SAM-dependent methyltransferase [Prosthecochloris]|uniref:Methyltransferase type 11 n=1 Tax=Prosthecochloris marina TaxID=2017681 RepID=A0A317T8F7_9CHLB|nr:MULTISPECIES: class I SAM-dependent methyltransferase [Prosthecochloris]PWW83029.1 methyltransferase type 11 [Prosthecochloris marina]UZJ38648.1 class I SAM-dependent methyltransferase [Prosthecochloris sp. SCSIO W1103]
MIDKPEKEWFAEWFNHPLYLKVYSHRNDDEARTCLETIISKTGLESFEPSGIAVMDIACGAGRHALELARQGFRTTANDLSPFLLECTRSQAEQENISIECTREDMRHITAENRYDLVVQLFASFGYFKTKEEDLQVLQNVYRSLKNDGWYILDLMNPVYLKKNLIPTSSRNIEGLNVSEQRSIKSNRVIKQITIRSSDESISFEESVRLYSLKTMEDMLESTGFIIDGIIGNYKGAAYNTETSPRMMIFAKKEELKRS